MKIFASLRTSRLLWLGAFVLVVLALIPPVVTSNPAALNLLLITLMYVALSSAWNLGCGYSGYISLGHAAFNGFGAYALGMLVNWLVANHLEIAGPYGPFLLAPVIGLLTAVVAIPFAWVAFRTRLTAFVIVTLTPATCCVPPLFMPLRFSTPFDPSHKQVSKIATTFGENFLASATASSMWS